MGKRDESLVGQAALGWCWLWWVHGSTEGGTRGSWRGRAGVGGLAAASWCPNLLQGPTGAQGSCSLPPPPPAPPTAIPSSHRAGGEEAAWHSPGFPVHRVRSHSWAVLETAAFSVAPRCRGAAWAHCGTGLGVGRCHGAASVPRARAARACPWEHGVLVCKKGHEGPQVPPS